MDDVRRTSAKVTLAIAFQRELAILKRRISAGEDDGEERGDGRSHWAEAVVDDADVVAAAAAGAPMRGRRGGKYSSTGVESLVKREAAEAAAAAAAAAAAQVKEEEGDDSVKDEDMSDGEAPSPGAVGPARYCSSTPRHRMPFKSRNDGSKYV